MARDPEQDEDQGRNASAIPSPLLRRATATVSFERLWPWIVAALVTVSVFVTLSFAGLWHVLPPFARAAGVVLFVVAVVAVNVC